MRNMLTDRARRRWELEAAKAARPESAGPYRGHDTVGAISLDMQGVDGCRHIDIAALYEASGQSR